MTSSSNKKNIPNPEMSNNIAIHIGKNAYLPGAKAAVTFANREYFSNLDTEALSISDGKESYKYIQWGEEDDYPNTIRDAVYKNPTLSRGVEFNVVATNGRGIRPVLKDEEGKLTELKADDPVSLFFQDNQIDDWFLEQITDMHLFFNTFNELILSEDGSQILMLNSKEAMFSRLQMRDDKGIIQNHFYSAKFGTDEKPDEDEIAVSKVLPTKFTYNALMSATGQLEGSKDKKVRRYILPCRFPAPGAIYYPKAYWHSIIDSGWLEFANAIPEFKKALMANQITIKYLIVFSDQYFPTIFKNEGITKDEDKKVRIKKEYDNMNNFLTDTKNTAKSFITYANKYFGSNGKEEYRNMVEIKPIENLFKGGEFIEDSAEANNIISYAIGVHPSITGSNPGKTGSINGTEARELFNLKRVLLWAYRAQIIKVLYFIKRYNKWPENLYFAIDDIALTTLDKDKTGLTTITSVKY
jgi:hypothetical protein